MQAQAPAPPETAFEDHLRERCAELGTDAVAAAMERLEEVAAITGQYRAREDAATRLRRAS